VSRFGFMSARVREMLLTYAPTPAGLPTQSRADEHVCANFEIEPSCRLRSPLKRPDAWRPCRWAVPPVKGIEMAAKHHDCRVRIRYPGSPR